MKRKTGKHKGAALIEFLLIIPVLISLWVGLYKLNSLYVIKQNMTISARYGAFANDAAVTLKIREQMFSCRLIDGKCLLVEIGAKVVKPIYRSDEETVALIYTYPFTPGLPSLVMREEYGLNSNAWRVGSKRKKKLPDLEEGTKWQDIFTR